jgi:large subunit ribosomal protein L10
LVKLERAEKERLVEDIRGRLEKARAIFIAEYKGIKANEMNELRKTLRDASIDLKIVRNTLARRAVKGTATERISDQLTGSTAMAFSYGDAALAAKMLVQFAKERPNLKLRLCALGEKVIGPEDIRGLAELPSREVLLARLLGSVSSPLSGFARVLSGVPRNFLYALNAIQGAKAGRQ